MNKICIIASLVLMAFGSCKDPVDNVEKKEKPSLNLEFKARMGNADLAINTQGNIMSNGDDILVNNWGIIMSGIKLIKTDGSEVLLGDGYGYVNLASSIRTMEYKDLPAGDYKGVKFTLGVDATTNHADPSGWPAKHPLNITYTNMHWGWAGGYIFQAFEGKFKNAMQTSPVGFSWHTATDACTKEIVMMKNFTLNLNDKKNGKIYVAIDKMLDENVMISAMPTNHSGSSTELAAMQKLLSNLNNTYSIHSIE